jgi:hypothetical protein
MTPLGALILVVLLIVYEAVSLGLVLTKIRNPGVNVFLFNAFQGLTTAVTRIS